MADNTGVEQQPKFWNTAVRLPISADEDRSGGWACEGCNLVHQQTEGMSFWAMSDPKPREICRKIADEPMPLTK